MNYTFHNSSIVSVNSDTIVLNVSSKTRTFVDAKLISAVDGKIVLDLPPFKLTKEIQELNDQLAAEGKCWNPDTMQIEKLRWKPVTGQTYYYVALEIRPYIAFHIWKNDNIDDEHYQSKNCFKTEEEAAVVMEKIKKLLLEV